MYEDDMNEEAYRDLVRRIERHNKEKRDNAKRVRNIRGVRDCLEDLARLKSYPNNAPTFVKNSEETQRKQDERRAEQFSQYVDGELDKYNDLMELYEMFEDIEYKERAEKILSNLKEESDKHKEVK